MKTRIQI